MFVHLFLNRKERKAKDIPIGGRKVFTLQDLPEKKPEERNNIYKGFEGSEGAGGGVTMCERMAAITKLGVRQWTTFP